MLYCVVLSTNAKEKRKKKRKACKNGAVTQDREGRKIVRLQGDIESDKSIQTNQILKTERVEKKKKQIRFQPATIKEMSNNYGTPV